jgi:hypothetical protein
MMDLAVAFVFFGIAFLVVLAVAGSKLAGWESRRRAARRRNDATQVTSGRSPQK